MTPLFREAEPKDAEAIATMINLLTEEISGHSNSRYFRINIEGSIRLCRDLLTEGHCAAILAYSGERPIAVATIVETYALYAGGKVGVVQELYVDAGFRSRGVGAQLLKQVQEYGLRRDWCCLELTTPPLPEFARTLGFYEQNGLSAVGGRKMRQYLKPKEA